MIAFMFYQLAWWAYGSWRTVTAHVRVIVPLVFITAILLVRLCAP